LSRSCSATPRDRLKPAFDSASVGGGDQYFDPSSLKAAKPTADATLVAVDCTVNYDLCQRYKISSYPGIKYFAAGSTASSTGRTFGGGRSADAIRDWLNEDDADKRFEDDDEEEAPVASEDEEADDEAAKAAAERKKMEARRSRKLPSWEGERGAVSLVSSPKEWRAYQKEHVEADADAEVEFWPYLAMFFAPWCAHCKELKPSYAAASTALKDGHGMEHVMAAVDCTKHGNDRGSFRRALCGAKRYNVTTYPTFLWVTGTGASDYEDVDDEVVQKGADAKTGQAQAFVDFVLGKVRELGVMSDDEEEAESLDDGTADLGAFGDADGEEEGEDDYDEGGDAGGKDEL